MNAAAQPAGGTDSTERFEVDPTLPGLTFTGTFVSEFSKLLALRTTWWLSSVAALLTVVIGALVAVSSVVTDQDAGPGADPAALASDGTTGLAFAMILLGALGVIAITTEFTTGAIRSSLTAAPARSLLMAAKALAVAAWTGLVTAVTVLLSHLTVALIAEPLSLSSIVTEGEVTMTYLTSWAAVLLTALMGFGLGALLRSSAGAIVTLAVILFVIQIALSIIWGVSDGAAWADALMRMEYMYLVGEFTSESDPQVPFGPDPMPRWQAGLGLLAWSGIPVLLGWLSFTRRDS